MSLPEILRGLPLERLQTIYLLRNVEDSTSPAVRKATTTVDKILADMKDGYASAAMIMQCDSRMLRLLQLATMLAGGNHVDVEDILAETGGKESLPALRIAADKLLDLGLLFPKGNDKFFIDTLVKDAVPLPLSERYGLKACLDKEPQDSLHRIARSIGLETVGNKATVIARIFSYLIDEGGASRVLDKMLPEDQELVARLLDYGGVVPVAEFARRHLPDQRNGYYYFDYHARTGGADSKMRPLERLTSSGLVFLFGYAYSYNQQLLMPREILRLFSGDRDESLWLSPPPTLRPLETDSTAVAVGGSRRNETFVRDVTTFLAALDRVDALRTQQDLMNKTALRSIAKLYFQENEAYAAFIYALCSSGGLVMAHGEKKRYSITQQGEKWLKAGAAAQWASLFRVWLRTAQWQETEEDPLENETTSAYYAGGTLYLRSMTMKIIGEESLPEPCSIRSLVETAVDRFPLALTQSTTASSGISPLQFYQNIIGQSLYWLGVTEVIDAKSSPVPSEPAAKPSRKKDIPAPEPVGYRLTERGAMACSGNLDHFPDSFPEESHFILQPSGEIIAPPYLDSEALFKLLSIADPAKSGMLQITRDSLRRALDNGLSEREITAFLQARSRTGVPQPVEYLVREVAGKHGQIRLGSASLYLQADDPALLRELLARKELSGMFGTLLSDSVAVLTTSDSERAMRDLRKAGYAPIEDKANTKPERPKATGRRGESDALKLSEEVRKAIKQSLDRG